MTGNGSNATDEPARAIEALVFASEQPLSLSDLARHLEDVSPLVIQSALQSLAADYAERGIVLVERGGRWHFQTAADLAHHLRRTQDQPRRLSRAATEVLAIIAYHEPVSRPEIEAIRGVQTAKGTLDVLLEAGWVRMAGRREVPGRPVVYATTQAFLQHFGLPSHADLPRIEELKAAGLLGATDAAEPPADTALD